MKQRCLGCMAEYEQEYGICPYCGYEPSGQAENPLHLRPGTRLAGLYTAGRVLGYGGFGVTYIAFDGILNQRVAVKEYLPSEFATRMAGNSQVSVFGGNKAEQFSDGLLKFVDEAKRLAKFQGEEGIVRVFDSFEENQTAYIVMEYLEGETLTAYLEREGKIPPEKALAWLEPVARSLEVVHQAGIIHRDIAPDNIFLASDGRVKLIDFGAARYATTSHSRSLTVIIKPGYSPEEQYRSRGDQGPHTDVYALASVFYRMITGAAPPDALERRAVLENKGKDILPPPSKYCGIDSGMENAVLNAMNVRIEDRTASVGDFWAELTSEEPVKRRGNRIKALNLARWPLGLKIGVPAFGLGALALIVLLLTGVIGPKAVQAGNIVMGDGMTRVPGVINYSIGAAQDMLDGQRLTPVIGGRRQSDEILPDLVLAQSVEAGQVVAVNSTVELYISERTDQPDEDGMAPETMYCTEAEALARFRRQGIEPQLERVYSADAAEGLVIGQSVEAGAPLPADGKVVLTVSLGPDPAQAGQTQTGPAGTEAPGAALPLRLNRTSLSLYAGDAVGLTASGGTGVYQWSSSNPSVASVQNGSVTAAGSGRAVITVASGAETASCPVTVRDYSLILNQSSLSMAKGYSMQLSVSGVPAEAVVSWSSSDNSVAAVRDGQVTGTGTGNAVITAQAVYRGNSYAATCDVEVTGSELYSSCQVNMRAGETRDLKTTLFTAESQFASEWSSSNTAVAAVSGGVVTAVSPGVADVTVIRLWHGQTWHENIQITVTGGVKPEPTPTPGPAPTSTSEPTGLLELIPGQMSLRVGERQTLSVRTYPDHSLVKVTISDERVVDLTNEGVVCALSPGTAVLTAEMTYNGRTYTDTCRVTVTGSPAPTPTPTPTPGIVVTPEPNDITIGSLPPGIEPIGSNVTLSPSSLQLKPGEIAYITASAHSTHPAYPIVGEPSFSWSSSNLSVATVSRSGQVTAVGPGTATITVEMSCGELHGVSTCWVRVLEPAGVTLSQTSMRFRDVGNGAVGIGNLTATTVPEGQTVAWASSNPSVADVVNGRVMVLKPGTAVITAQITYQGKTYTASCRIIAEGA